MKPSPPARARPVVATLVALKKSLREVLFISLINSSLVMVGSYLLKLWEWSQVQEATGSRRLFGICFDSSTSIPGSHRFCHSQRGIATIYRARWRVPSTKRHYQRCSAMYPWHPVWLGIMTARYLARRMASRMAGRFALHLRSWTTAQFHLSFSPLVVGFAYFGPSYCSFTLLRPRILLFSVVLLKSLF